MKEIKFRAWDEFNNKMYTPDNKGIFFDEFSHEEMLISGCKGMIFVCDYSPVSGLILMQYTGLKDKNEVEIYEGDLVKFRANYSTAPCGDMIGKVVLTEYRLEIHSENGYVYDAENETDEFPYAHCEVIGNIYENPELLK